MSVWNPQPGEEILDDRPWGGSFTAHAMARQTGPQTRGRLRRIMSAQDYLMMAVGYLPTSSRSCH
ncbi:hypothetical protein H112_07003 [Trichophyton rubrum D6]|uniref:Uncharacterized protein n=2 Tax=Trichophyton TaxID=5550 RepID=A0A022VUL4_TRIRU|nr:hypothetical protein H100_07027 [Trichophyton rubrum MR850]EZF38799.1 hypothetical protein H102_06988 [Trichophyton rubrum CBS 100081]EZF49433.1 hypothetical protein H103_07012 [Trichophyton rubrum CBS 288.86]EZF60099.1 hypothetical protein H104_06966 [Trichophyton rubrum CBS 289.86]EZF70563.1 hypothetical protein H105_07025 [Trichophyton soudanense CBS 452.61]EZF81445.1 hypothetical protein H110_07007 [Trichophyton rubrum MR1448]EZF92058.1 hypothetical protein H113_07062 [Trichophyton rub